MMITMACETRRGLCGVPLPSSCHLVGRHPRRCHRRPGEGPERHDVVGRYYDSTTGQFLSVDPAVQQTQQAYVYVGDDPVNGTDPVGLKHCGLNPFCYIGSAYDKGNNAVNRALSDADQGLQGFLSGNSAVGSCSNLAVGDQAFCDFGAFLGGVIGFFGDDADIENANFAQKEASEIFSPGGRFAGETISEVAEHLRDGTLLPEDVPVQVIVRDGNTLILNTRSALALEEAGIPRIRWSIENVTNDPAAEARLSGQLERNGLSSSGTSTVRIVGR
jgi:hypothetical protein